MKKYSYTDLEDAIYQVWQTKDDIKMLFAYYYDAPKPMTEDEMGNTLLGLEMLHEIRCHFLHDMFRRVHELDEYCTDPEKLAAREALFGKKKGKKK